MSKIRVCLLTLVLACGGLAQNTTKDTPCRTLVNCMADADEARTRCDKQRKAAVDKFQTSLQFQPDDCVALNSKSDELLELIVQQRKQKRDCLMNSLGDTVPMGDPKKQGQCRKLVSDFQSKRNSTSARRQRRRASVKLNTSITAANSSIVANGSSSKNANLTSSEVVRNTTKDRKTNATTTAERTAEVQRLRRCYQNADAKEKICRNLASCCSEVTPCDIKYHLSPLHKQIYQIELDLFYLRRRCQQQQQQKAKDKNDHHGNHTNTTLMNSGKENGKAKKKNR